MTSTVYAKVGQKEYDTGLHTTTPDPCLIQKLLKMAVDAGDEYFVLETTAHALDQNRVFGIRFTRSVIRNVTHEHLDYHPDYENYLHAKSRLFLNSKTSVVNKDDASYAKLHTILKQNGKHFITYSFQS